MCTMETTAQQDEGDSFLSLAARKCELSTLAVAATAAAASAVTATTEHISLLHAAKGVAHSPQYTGS